MLNPRRKLAVVTCKTRKPCYRRETVRCRSCSLRFADIH